MKVDEIKKLIEAATPGNWRWLFSGKSDSGSDMFLMFNKDVSDPTHTWVLDAGSDGNDCGVYVRKEDAAFIAASRTLMPQMADRIEELEKRNAKLEKVVEAVKAHTAMHDKTGKQCSLCKALAALEAE